MIAVSNSKLELELELELDNFDSIPLLVFTQAGHKTDFKLIQDLYGRYPAGVQVSVSNNT